MRPYDDEQDGTWAAFVKFAVAAAIVAALFMLGAVFAPSAFSATAPLCVPRSELLNKLPRVYQERPVWLGLQRISANNGKNYTEVYFELWSGPESWSLVTGVQGSDKVCFIATGGDSVLRPQAPIPPAQPTAREE